MPIVNISFAVLSDIVWRRILEASAFQFQFKKNEFFRSLQDLEGLRKSADYKTSSISAASAWLLYSAGIFSVPVLSSRSGLLLGDRRLRWHWPPMSPGRTVRFIRATVATRLIFRP